MELALLMDMSAIFADFGVGLSTQFSGPLKGGSVVRTSAPTTDDGGSIVTPGTVSVADCSVQVENVTEAMRQADGYTDEDMRLLVLASTLEGTIDTDAEIEVLEGPYFGRWSVASVASDPFGTYWDCRGRLASRQIGRFFAGESDGTASAVGDLTADCRLGGAVAVISSPAGSLQLSTHFAGMSVATSGAAGIIGGGAFLSGPVAGASAVIGSLSMAAYLAATSPGSATVTGTLAGYAKFSGATAAQSVVAGGMTGLAALTGASAAQSAAAGQPRMWDPVTDLGAALLGFWDAERADLITLSGSSVTTWADIVGGYAPTQGVTGSKPIYASNSFNGRPGIAFDGTDDSLLLGSQPFPSGSAACEMWMLADQRALPADATTRIGFTYGAGGSATTRYSGRTVVSAVNRAFANAGNGTAAVQVTDTAVDLSGKHVVRVTVSATTETVSVDGNTAVSTASVPSTGTANVRIGGTVAGSNFANMIANAILVTSPLNTAQAAQMLAFLKGRGGIA